MNKAELTALIRELPAGFGRELFPLAGVDAKLAATPERMSEDEVQRLYASADEIITKRGDREDANRRQAAAELGLKKTKDGDVYDLERGMQRPGSGGGIPGGREW